MENRHLSGIYIVPFEERWASEFNSLNQVISDALGDLIQHIEHVGSTSVKGLAAKPIIDLDVVIKDRSFFSKVAEKLHELGYIHKGDLGIEGREAFGRTDIHVPWGENARQWMEHHLYVCTKDNEELHRHVTFRNYLISHPDVASEYEQLKLHLAKTARSREEYTEAKTEFINRVLDLAK